MANHRGDDGRSDLLGARPDQQRPTKDDPVFTCLGWLDELNAEIGSLRVSVRGSAMADTAALDRDLRSIQVVLGQIMGRVAWAPGSGSRGEGVTESELARLESLTGSLRSKTAVEHRFHVPGDGPEPASRADLARTRCRTAERALVAYESAVAADDVDSAGHGLQIERSYVNRLSDYFFALARHAEQSLR